MTQIMVMTEEGLRPGWVCTFVGGPDAGETRIVVHKPCQHMPTIDGAIIAGPSGSGYYRLAIVDDVDVEARHAPELGAVQSDPRLS